MDKCINTKHPEFIKLAEQANINPLILKSKVGVWQEKNNSDDFPTLQELGLGHRNSEIKEGVSELFEQNPELANAVYEALGLNTINGSEITYTDEEGNPCAKMGLTNTTKGTGWKIVKDFNGQPKHSNGGVDITISDKGVTMRREGKDIKAKYGLLIINNN
jgi:hypothetical protein